MARRPPTPQHRVSYCLISSRFWWSLWTATSVPRPGARVVDPWIPPTPRTRLVAPDARGEAVPSNRQALLIAPGSTYSSWAVGSRSAEEPVPQAASVDCRHSHRIPKNYNSLLVLDTSKVAAEATFRSSVVALLLLRATRCGPRRWLLGRAQCLASMSQSAAGTSPTKSTSSRMVGSADRLEKSGGTG